jgi:ParB family chromosome partitioning protein
MPQRSGLGKGLEALIPGGENALVRTGGVTQAAVNLIKRNPHQPRINLHEEQLDGLAVSIREHGVIQPLIVSQTEDGKYTLIAGERRLQAAQKAGLSSVPVIVRQASNREFLELALVENIQRADLNPLEEAEAYRHLVEEFGLSHELLSKRVGKSRVAITNTLRLLGAADDVKQALVDEKITEGHARALLSLSSMKAQESALKTVINHGLNVRQTEELVKKFQGHKGVKKNRTSSNPELIELEKRLRASLGTRVTLRHEKKGGTLTIHYYSDEELDALLDKLLVA